MLIWWFSAGRFGAVTSIQLFNEESIWCGKKSIASYIESYLIEQMEEDSQGNDWLIEFAQKWT